VDFSQGGGGGHIKSLFKEDPLMKPLAGAGTTTKSNQVTSGFNFGSLDKPLVSLIPGEKVVPEKETFFQKKKREEIERMELEINQERMKIARSETDHQKKLEDLRSKNKNDLESIEAAQKVTINLLIQEKEKTVEAHSEALAREKLKMEVHHQAELESKQRQHQNQLD
jgi:hypothetical protein